MERVEIETPYGFYMVWPAYLWPLRFPRWLARRRREIVCRIRGHRWREPHTNPLLGDFRTCARCFTNEKVGPYPEFKIEAGTLIPQPPRFVWQEDEL